MQPTKPWSLLVVAVVSAAVAWIAVRLWFDNLAPLPWTVVPALALLAIGELAIARNLGPRLRGRPGARPIQPMAVPRVVALAKASSAAAAVFGGLALGVAIYTLPSLAKPVPRHDALAATFTAVAAICLAAAAMYLERCCRAPDPPDDDDSAGSDGGRGSSANGQHGRGR